MMMKKDSEKTRRFRYMAPTLVAGVTIFGVSGALAGFKAVVHDDTHYLTCNISRLVQDGNGVQVVLDAGATCFDYMKEGTLADSLKFVAGAYNGTLKAGCTFSQTTLTSDGELLIKADGQCISTNGTYNVADIDYNCFIDEDNKAFVLNVPSYDMDDVCDETLPASITAGNVTVTGPTPPVTVEFRTRGTVRINPPFTVASEHVFKVNTGMISGS